MYSKYPAFFLNKNIKSSSGVQFSNVVKIPSAIESLYRGDNNLTGIIFLLPTLITGVFCQNFPEVVDIEQIRLHKLTNLSNDFHMVSMSEDPQIALDWGNGCFITIDPVSFSDYIVDVHATFSENQLNLPGRMEREKEHVALAVPFCSIKKITIHNKELANPFYLSIPQENHEAKMELNTLYGELISLLRKKYTQEVDEKEEQIALRTYAIRYLDFYAKFCGCDNPFDKTIAQLSELYPEFMSNFLQSSHFSSKTGLMKEIVVNSLDNLFKEHPYTKSIDASYIYRVKESTTCYEDDWAKPVYD
ncbi:TPA: lpg0181 family Dot/Icm T4SS effector [Legionella pneumophila]|uniref:NAD(+)--arginine ADP-ribosyltransferase Lart1 n=2 Tax=Legionella pneumophila TaxID=446 RepID=LART1_LEGPH|nr:lpg0181 family Dot/Icm T4SS effector [Legionella pneumophila]Q5ZZ30.1 RecName: Full=NAD(+)--arginine ADP-ribosyltransferase Lart1; AltName: Full=Legionella ADP-ribosyltransferase 1; Short=Legionella ART 1; AltName: Full=Mono-ADP-ribosyltransferase; Short=Mono-ART; Short=mART [Legionella pneumophila subsp. pneumophila str. Philadelphia 1]WBV62980.1 lpg0181 family Dot/Icm T4SS effector [Legionella pneumophila 130b]AAU26288.1 hypothetical protein lpg0181 [Legionella pneumophila subsp. pneumophil